MALTGDLDNALVLIDQVIAQVERPGWEERLRYAETLRLKGWMLSLKGDLDGAERNFSTHSTGHAASRHNPGSCARRLAWHAYGRANANARRRMSRSPRFMVVSPKASTPRICRKRKCCWMSWHERHVTVLTSCIAGRWRPPIQEHLIHMTIRRSIAVFLAFSILAAAVSIAAATPWAMIAGRVMGRVEKMTKPPEGDQPGIDVATVVLNAEASKVYATTAVPPDQPADDIVKNRGER
jgi:hypothetical protein